MNQIKCNSAYRKYSKQAYLDFCTKVSNGIYNNPDTFTNPPFTKADFENAFTKYSDAAAQYKIAPTVQKTNYDNAKNNMNATLGKTADYVDVVANGDESIIYLAGYVPTKGTNSKSQPITEAATGTAKRGEAGQIVTNAAAVKNKGTISYSVVVSVGTTLPEGSYVNGQVQISGTTLVVVNSSRNRKKIIYNLPSGISYVYFLAYNPVSASPLGEPVSVSV